MLSREEGHSVPSLGSARAFVFSCPSRPFLWVLGMKIVFSTVHTVRAVRTQLSVLPITRKSHAKTIHSANLYILAGYVR
jgi:hypothetical protein